MAKSGFTLEELETLRLELEKDSEALASSMRSKAQEMIAPMPSGGKVQSLLNNAERIIAIYDGVRVGFKLFRQVRRLFSS